MTDAVDIAGRLEACFEEIRTTRMAGVPILNEALRVKAVGGRDWNGHWLGVLVTPWFMNLMLVPSQDDEAVSAGTKRLFSFPAGRFEFIRGHEEGTGPYWMCSLFSPVFEFADPETAEEAAAAALDALFGEEDAADESEVAIAQMWRGEEPASDAADPGMEPQEEPAPVREAPVDVSRRGFLTGRREDRP